MSTIVPKEVDELMILGAIGSHIAKAIDLAVKTGEDYLADQLEVLEASVEGKIMRAAQALSSDGSLDA